MGCLLSHFSCVQLFATLWTIARHASQSMEFSRQKCWTRLACPSSGDLPDPRTEPKSPESPALQSDSLLLSHHGSPYYSLILLKLHFTEATQAIIITLHYQNSLLSSLPISIYIFYLSCTEESEGSFKNMIMMILPDVWWWHFLFKTLSWLSMAHNIKSKQFSCDVRQGFVMLLLSRFSHVWLSATP